MPGRNRGKQHVSLSKVGRNSAGVIRISFLAMKTILLVRNSGANHDDGPALELARTVLHYLGVTPSGSGSKFSGSLTACASHASPHAARTEGPQWSSIVDISKTVDSFFSSSISVVAVAMYLLSYF